LALGKFRPFYLVLNFPFEPVIPLRIVLPALLLVAQLHNELIELTFERW